MGLGENPAESDNSSDDNPERDDDDSGEEDSEGSDEEINEVKEQNTWLNGNCMHGLVSWLANTALG